MVQIDALWAYGIGAGVALAEAPALCARRRRSPALAGLSAYLLLVFIPCGMWLLAKFPSWETMHVVPDPPSWFAGAFFLGVLLSAAVGFFGTTWLLSRGQVWWSFLQWVWPHASMFFLLLHGWDGTGLKRFLSARGESPHGEITVETVVRWLESPVAVTLAVMGVVVLPAMALLGALVRSRAVGGDTRAGWSFAGLLTVTALGPCAAVAVAAAAVAALSGLVPAALLVLGAALVIGRRRSRPARWTAGRLLPQATRHPAARPGTVPAPAASADDAADAQHPAAHLRREHT
ncbi:hypothetical protein [Streptomyces aureocirculatus]|uniref:hypothetical protein n=1 Tax=Streptomyces aureocirculatus TaxID=67275 RepID=UPI0004C5FC4E|nr:hypothetical protein [Streptomyces aureocirculatus]